MADDTAGVVVTCPTCRHTSDRQLGWLRTVRVWDCPFCGAALEVDYAQLEKSIAEQNSPRAEITARLSPRPNRGITTRRTR
jgi:hypothetical protein